VKKDFLLEIGCENLPSGYVDDAAAQLRKLFEAGLRAERIGCDALEVMGTPKRLVVRCAGLESRAAAAETKVIGPPAKVGVAPDGSYTQAAAGFARSQGVPVEALARVETERGEYLAVIKRAAGGSTVALLKERVPRWIGEIRSPKSMRWDRSGVRFARPIRSILCLYGSAVVRLRFGDVTAGRATRLSPMFEDEVSVPDVAGYFALMRRRGIILDAGERRDCVRDQAIACAERAGGRLVEDEELVGIVANLLERPVAMAGSYDDSFLALPREVVVTALKSHQRYFSVSGPGEKLLPHFVAFADGPHRGSRGIVRGYERVLVARLDDAVFYYREDTARPLAEMASRLTGVVWLEGLGNVAEKAQRLEELGTWLRAAWGLPDGDLDRRVRRAALLAKADLASEMVKDGKEFTSLQGYIGREYARASGEDTEVAEAVYEHYLPRFSGDRIPSSDTSALLALADKLDTIAGCFIMGLEPTGSQDPYALRRQAVGVLRIMIARRAPVPLDEMIAKSLALFGPKTAGLSCRPAAELAPAIRDFFTQRFSQMLRQDGADHDLVAAVLAAPWRTPYEAGEMVAELVRMRKSGELAPFALAMKRVSNIIPKKMKGALFADAARGALDAFARRDESALGFSSSLFTEEAERALAEQVSLACAAIAGLERSHEFQKSIEILRALVPFINRYFDDVLVNAEDSRVRDNRIAFLLSTYKAFSLVSEFALIAGE
jgi:glycyl-tRNA synthetase beta chain